MVERKRKVGWSTDENASAEANVLTDFNRPTETTLELFSKK